MCPSYQATREEKDVTRGRMRILQEVAQRGAAAGIARDALIRGFADSAVRSALDLCLGCKACGKDCPTGIDVARFKSEALYRGYKEGFVRVHIICWATFPVLLGLQYQFQELRLQPMPP